MTGSPRQAALGEKSHRSACRENRSKKSQGPAIPGRASVNNPEKKGNKPPRSGLVQRGVIMTLEAFVDARKLSP
jgi:hypothetical protein